MLISVRVRRISRRKVAAHSAFNILVRDQEWLGRAMLLYWAGIYAELPNRAAALVLLTELPSCRATTTEAEVISESCCNLCLISSLRCFTRTIAP